MKDDERMCLDFVEQILTGKILHNLDVEAIRGCLPNIYKYPVRLEPRHIDFNADDTYASSKEVRFEIPLKKAPQWHSAEIIFDLPDAIQWSQIEQAISCFSGYSECFVFEIVGNEKGISYYISCSRKNLLNAVGNVIGKLPDMDLIETVNESVELIRSADYDVFSLYELYVTPPYYHQIYDYKDRFSSPLDNLLKIMASLPPDELGIYQVLFQTAQSPWQKNIKNALEAEEALRNKHHFGKSLSREIKDFATKPLFLVRPRFAFVSTSKLIPESLKSVIGDFQHEGKKVLWHDKAEFEQLIGREKVTDMICNRVAHMTGMILNSAELAGFIHFPDASIEKHGIPIRKYHEHKIPQRILCPGIPVGKIGQRTVHIPASAKNFNTYRIGRSTTGKTTSMIHQIIHHVENGDGVAVFDPHNHLIPEILSSEKLASKYEKVCLFDPCDSGYVLDYNPFHVDNPEDIGRLTADYIDSSKSLFSTSWGYRMAHILGMGYYALFTLRENLSALPALFSNSQQGREMQRRVASSTSNPEVKRFFEHDIARFPQDAFLPVINKITMLLMDDRTHRIFSRKNNKIDISRIMDEGHVLLVSLPTGILGAEISAQLGAMLLAQLQKAAFHRASMEQQDRKPFFIFVDECYRFSATGIYEAIINECRKFGVFISLAHQDTGQVSEATLKTFLSINNLFFFGMNMEDSKRLVKALDNRVKPEEMTNLCIGEVIARIGNDIAKITTFSPDELKTSKDVERLIIEHSRKKYYTKIEDLKPERHSAKERFYDSF